MEHHYLELIEQISSQGFALLDNFLSSEHYQQLKLIANQLIKKQQFVAAKIGHASQASLNSTIRADSIYWLDEVTETREIKAFFTIMYKIMKCFNETLFLSLVEIETHFAHYQAGGFYHRHVDQFKNKKARKISFVYYMNDGWQPQFGGNLHIYNTEDVFLTDLLPLANRLIVFKSDLPHEVTQTTHSRLSIAGWMRTRTSCTD